MLEKIKPLIKWLYYRVTTSATPNSATENLTAKVYFLILVAHQINRRQNHNQQLGKSALQGLC